MLVCLACLIGSPCTVLRSSYGDTIYLKNGSKYDNVIVIEETETELVLEFPGGKTRTVSRTSVAGRIVDTRTKQKIDHGVRSMKTESESDQTSPGSHRSTRSGRGTVRAFRNSDGIPIFTNVPARYDSEEYEEILTQLEPITLYRPGDVRTSLLLKRALTQEVYVSDARRTYSVGLARELHELVMFYSAEYDVRPELIMAVIKAESDFDEKAVSSKGARGLMQLMPRTAAAMGITDCFDPQQNIAGGTQYLSRLLKMFGNDELLAVAAYNAGPGRVKRHGGIPPIRETREYVARVFRHAELYAKRFSS